MIFALKANYSLDGICFHRRLLTRDYPKFQGHWKAARDFKYHCNVSASYRLEIGGPTVRSFRNKIVRYWS